MEEAVGRPEQPAEMLPAIWTDLDLPAEAREPAPVHAGLACGPAGRVREAPEVEAQAVGVHAGVLVGPAHRDPGRGGGDRVEAERARDDAGGHLLLDRPV